MFKIVIYIKDYRYIQKNKLVKRKKLFSLSDSWSQGGISFLLKLTNLICTKKLSFAFDVYNYNKKFY